MSKTNQQKYEVTKAIAAIAIDLSQTHGSPVRLLPDGSGTPNVADVLARGGNVTAKSDVEDLYGRAIIELRSSGIFVVPVTDFYFSLVAAGKAPADDDDLVKCIAGLAGHGKRTVGFHFPSSEDDLLYIASLIGRMDSGRGKVEAVAKETKRANGKAALSAGKAHEVLTHQPKRTQIAALPGKV